MINLRSILLAMAMLVTCVSGAQEFLPINSEQWPATGTGLEADQLGRVYLWNQDELKQYSAEGRLLNTYSQRNLGPITRVDVSNPMKILVTHQALTRLVLLDNTLSVQSDVISLENIGFDQAVTICTSVANGFWLYDNRDAALVRLSERTQVVSQNTYLTQQTGKRIVPVYMIERNNFLYMLTEGTGVFVFDQFGTYVKAYREVAGIWFQVTDDGIFWLEGGALAYRSLSGETTWQKALPYTEFTAIAVSSKKLFLLKGEKLSAYTIKM